MFRVTPPGYLARLERTQTPIPGAPAHMLPVRTLCPTYDPIQCASRPNQVQPIVDLVVETDLRPQSKGGRVCKEARSARPRTTVVLIVLNLAPCDLSEASMGCVRVRGWLCRTASPGKLVARLFRCEPWPGPGWAGTRTHWGHRSGKGSLLAACAAEHNE